MDNVTRRAFVGTVGLAAVAATAGCSGNGGDGGDTVPGSDYPAIDEWLTETSVGGEAGTYDGNILDRREQDTVTVDVGAEGNNGAFAFAPVAVLVSAGTTVEWRWTGEGSPHNVVAAPADQIGESDYEFGSGEPEGGSGVKFTYTMDAPGVALYHCEPHLGLGMKGGIAVE